MGNKLCKFKKNLILRHRSNKFRTHTGIKMEYLCCLAFQDHMHSTFFIEFAHDRLTCNHYRVFIFVGAQLICPFLLCKAIELLYIYIRQL